MVLHCSCSRLLWRVCNVSVYFRKSTASSTLPVIRDPSSLHGKPYSVHCLKGLADLFTFMVNIAKCNILHQFTFKCYIVPEKKFTSPQPPKGRVMGSTVTIQNWNFQGVVGRFKPKHPPWEGYEYILEQHVKCSSW